ncbi:LysR family transcriptional regulator [Hominifimenecus sp. rT4P-3]|uniref:LysR family transcriptional regulator n=1 Tax=Hominifimenecus sp. rT4P-3 TaxID=3242979 RepID=UPI003DA2B381
MNLQQLIYFKKIAELEHYTRAAEELNITQPCLSRAISELEKELGAPLFFKKGRNIKLTQYGQLYLTHVQSALQELENGQTEINALLRPNSGSVSIAHISSMNRTYIPTLLSAFHADPHNQNIKLNFRIEPTLQFLSALKDNTIDIGLGAWVDDPQLELEHLYTEKLVLVVGHQHPLARKKHVTMQELSAYDFIAYDKKCGIRNEIDRLFQRTNTTCKILHESEDNYVVTGLVAAGIGIAIVPQIFGLDYYGVRSIEITGIDTFRNLYMMWNRNAYLSPPVKTFIQFMRNFSSPDFPKIIKASTY